jgi:hypothetical protein
MKIRIKGNFIRYRLSQSEVKTLAETGYLSDTTRFGPGDHQVFTYALRSREGIDGLRAEFEHGVITLFIPAAAAAVWYDEERVGFENTVAVAPGTSLTLLLEKDFACLDDSREDQSDNFPNPNAICG